MRAAGSRKQGDQSSGLISAPGDPLSRRGSGVSGSPGRAGHINPLDRGKRSFVHFARCINPTVGLLVVCGEARCCGGCWNECRCGFR